MNCCPNCFSDKELIAKIYQNANAKGSCDFCGSNNVLLINSKELEIDFISLFDIYSTDPNGHDLAIAIQRDWKIFNIENTDVIKDLLADIIEGLDNDYKKLLNSKVSISFPKEADHLLEVWESFKKEIKEENRFFISNMIDFELIKDILPIRTYNKGKIFYRSRIANDESGIEIKHMGKPPHKKASAGRANPKGISYLYLAESMSTTLYEARTGFLDFVSVGEFRLQEDINVIALRDAHQVSPFHPDYPVEEYIKNKPFIDELENELAKPLRRRDNELDYLPTQFLCEYIKNQGFDGVEYGSAMHNGGINLVLFNHDKVECTRARVYEIENINIQSKEISA